LEKHNFCAGLDIVGAVYRLESVIVDWILDEKEANGTEYDWFVNGHLPPFMEKRK